MAVIELFVDQFLAIDQGTPANNPQGLYVDQVLTLTDVAKNYRTVVELGQSLNFGQDAQVRRSIYNISISDYLAFYQSGADGPDEQVITQFFFIGQVVKLTEYEIVVQTLSITQSVSVDRARACSSTLVMTDVATCAVERSITVSQTFFIGSGGSGYLLREESYSITLPTISGPNTPEC